MQGTLVEDRAIKELLLWFLCREHLWKLFFPADYQPLVPTPEAQPGEKRQHKTLELKMTINANSTIDILFTKSLVRLEQW